MILKVDNVGAERISGGRLFQVTGPATQNARLPPSGLQLRLLYSEFNFGRARWDSKQRFPDTTDVRRGQEEARRKGQDR